jgi:hypothetical protein
VKKARTSEMRRKKLSNDYNAVNHSQMIDERRKKARRGGKKFNRNFPFNHSESSSSALVS